jgi:alpha-1,2-mannosyltransferase
MTLNHKKLDLYSFAMWLTFFLLYGYLFITSNGGIDDNKLPIGYDFYAFWSAGKVALEQGYPVAFDIKLLQQFQLSSLPVKDGYLNPWFYPPLLLYWLALFWAKLPYFYAYAVFVLMMFGFYYPTIKRFHGDFTLNTLMAFPAFLLSIVSGQNGAMSACFMILALLNLEKKPYLAGFFFALLAFKPQLCLLIPFALIASKQWKAILSGIITLLITCTIAFIAFGLDTWIAFFKTAFTARELVQGQGNVGFHKLASLYSAFRLWGMNEGLAYILHFTLALFVVIKTCQIWRGDNFLQKASTLILGTLLVTPHVLDYDYVMTALVFILFLKSKNLQVSKYEFAVLVVLWISPFVGRGLLEYTGIPLLFLSNIALFLCITPMKPLAFDKKMI